MYKKFIFSQAQTPLDLKKQRKEERRKQKQKGY